MSAEIDSGHETVPSDAVATHPHDNTLSDLSYNNGGSPHKQELVFAEEEVRPIVEAIASTGKFWIEWDKLKSMLSFKLKQVLSDYPEGKLTVEEQTSSLGETFPNLVERLDGALLSFDEGPPFTLQRLCEILLSAQSIYPKLTKLALALEKNLLVSSMLTSCADWNPPAISQGSYGMDRVVEKPKSEPPSEQNGVDSVMGDRDEPMADVEDAKDDGMSIDTEALEEKGTPSEANSAQPSNT